jgi:hypothetical protein
VECDLIPAIILWRTTGSYIFAIDGSHRLSALAARVNNDFGDGGISKRFFEGIIPEEQIRIAEDTRALVRRKVGLFSDYELSTTYPDKVKSEIVRRARILGALALQVQWVYGDANKAETSYFKINQEAAPINKTELFLLQARNKPNGLASRAIMRSGTSHKYWSKYPNDKKIQVEEIAKDINSMLFSPPLRTNHIKTLDLPIGGKVYSLMALSLVSDFVNIVNGVKQEGNALFLQRLDITYTDALDSRIL